MRCDGLLCREGLHDQAQELSLGASGLFAAERERATKRPLRCMVYRVVYLAALQCNSVAGCFGGNGATIRTASVVSQNRNQR